jgi:hypothetical protein
MSTVAVWSKEDRTKGIVSRRCAGKGDRINFRLGYMGGCVKKNRNLEMVFAGKKHKGQIQMTSLHPH